jgi:predicted small lipoprotein YifL
MASEETRDQGKPLSRRDFALHVATIAAAAVAAPAALVAEPQQKAGTHATRAAATPREGPLPLPPAEQAEIEAKYDAMIARYGSRLTDEQKTEARQALEFMQRGLEPLRAFPLENGDEPAEMYGALPSGAGPEPEG